MIFLFHSCRDFFNIDSNQVLKTDNNIIDTQNKARSAMFGILHQLQKIGDEHVIFGELRGDLLTVTENSSQELRDINNFEIKPDNSYLNEIKYYALINNCNYLISIIDTAMIVGKQKVLIREMAAAKGIRAWAYFQLCLNYGYVYYFEEPVLETEFSRYKKIEQNELINILIEDLLLFKPEDGTGSTYSYENFPDYGTIESFNSNMFFIPIRFMLGELYMWKKDYVNAANMYYQMMTGNRYLVHSTYRNRWTDSQFTRVDKRWGYQYSSNMDDEMIVIIPFAPEYQNNVTLLPSMFDPLTGEYLMAPSNTAINIWSSEIYSVSATNTTEGDLRALDSYSTLLSSEDHVEKEYAYVTKYNQDHITNYTILCRTSLIYLRYAEAVNRLNKPTLAFAVLKYGLNSTTMTSPERVNQKELTGESFLNFGQSSIILDGFFSSNSGLHARGCGRIDINPGYVIPDQFSGGQDTLLWVEEEILKEYAIETAFEGNRFQDLMRIANHRDDPIFLAKKVAEKFPAEAQNAIISKLSSKENWFLPGIRE
jgi:hypothetical protein